MPGAPWPCPAHVLQGPPGSVGLESTRGLAGGAMRASLTCWCSTSLFGLRVEWLTVKVKMSQSHMSMCVSASRVALTNSTPPAAQRTHTYSLGLGAGHPGSGCGQGWYPQASFLDTWTLPSPCPHGVVPLRASAPGPLFSQGHQSGWSRVPVTSS